jgi:hypothetical protein
MLFDRAKFKNLMHYVIWKTNGRDGFGATKLYKVLWFSEARAFVLHKTPITGAHFIREEHGPVPRLGRQIRAELMSDGLISERQIGKQWHFKSLVPPPQGFLTEKEKAIVDYWVRHIDEEHTAESISDFSHNFGWEIAAQGEPLPYHSILADRFRDPTDDEVKKAQERARVAGYH